MLEAKRFVALGIFREEDDGACIAPIISSVIESIQRGLGVPGTSSVILSCSIPRLHLGGFFCCCCRATSGSSVETESWCFFSSSGVSFRLAKGVHFAMTERPRPGHAAVSLVDSLLLHS